MFNFDYITKEDINEHNPNRQKNPWSYRKLIIRGSGSGKKSLFNLTNQQPDIDKIY